MNEAGNCRTRRDLGSFRPLAGFAETQLGGGRTVGTNVRNGRHGAAREALKLASKHNLIASQATGRPLHRSTVVAAT